MTELLQRALAKDILSGEISHAYILTGEKRLSQALAFAMALNCKNRDEEGNACGTCLSCRKLADNNHPDVFLVEPDRNAIRIEQTRKLISKLFLEKFEGEYKIAILQGCEAMRDEAANNLLKTLEEPPEHTVFLLLTESESSVLPTVRSRCRIVNLRGEGIDALDDENRQQYLQQAEQLLQGLSVLPLYKVLRLTAEWEKDREEALAFVGALSHVLMGAFKSSFGREGEFFLSAQPAAILKAAEQTQTAMEQLKANVNMKACLDMLFLRLWSCMKQK